MQLRAEALEAHLARGRLAPVYAVSGDEALLALEAQDAIRAAARKAGFTERTVLHADARTDWSLLEQATQSLSLFDERRIIEVRLPSGKPGKDGAAALQTLAAAGAQDVLAIVALPRLDRSTRESGWATALADAGAWVEVSAVERAQLPAWIGQRLARQKQRCEPAALAFLADRIEGNLLAGHQEILKLGLLHPPGDVSLEAVTDSVLDVARYEVFGLPVAMLAGDCARVMRTVEGLQAEGEALPLLVWTLMEEFHALLRVREAMAAGRPFQAVARENRLWGPRAALAERALPQLTTDLLAGLLDRCAELDRLAKGLRVPGRDSDPWLELADIALQLARRCGGTRPDRGRPSASRPITTGTPA
jgi:DNA polymerase-3 subunit delta